MVQQISSHFNVTKRVLITGGASGIGEAIVEQFILAGAKVAVLDKDEKATNTKAEIMVLGDVSDPSSVDKIFAECDRCWGGVDVVINNAGISIPASLIDTSVEMWNQVLSINLTGVFLVSQRAARRMIKQKEGLIINIGSVSGIVGMPNYLSYNVSKAGVIELTKTLAIELAPFVRVNAICPGYILTPMQEKEYTKAQLHDLASKIPSKRLGTPKEVAMLAVYLASYEAQFFTGTAIVMDGGETAGGLASFLNI